MPRREAPHIIPSPVLVLWGLQPMSYMRAGLPVRTADSAWDPYLSRYLALLSRELKSRHSGSERV
jgi:hypothetical protein